METEERFWINCTICRSKKSHTIFRINRLKGFKLKCTICGFVKKKYFNSKYLEPKKMSGLKREIKMLNLKCSIDKCKNQASSFSHTEPLCQFHSPHKVLDTKTSQLNKKQIKNGREKR